MWYWVVMAVLVIGCIALLSGTFFSIKKNKAEEAAERAEARKKKRKSQKCRRSGTYCQTFQRSRMWQFRQSGSGKRFEISPSG